MANIFVSYSSKNRLEIDALSVDINSLGHTVWFDKELTGGHVWWETILRELRGREIFLFALSRESLDSYPCRLEYGYAHALKKNILPILVSGEVSPNLLPPELSAIQYVDYRQRNADSAIRLSRALSLLPPPVPLPNPLPDSPEVPISQVGLLRQRIESRGTFNFEQQAGLVFKLKEEMVNPAYRADVLQLLRKMRDRDDLLARIAREIDAILIDENAVKVAPRPKAEAKPMVNDTVAVPVGKQRLPELVVSVSALAEIKNTLEESIIPVDKQDTIISRLRRMTRKAEDREDALILLKQLRDHRDVRVHIAEDIDFIIQDSQAKPIAEIRKPASPEAKQQAPVQVTPPQVRIQSTIASQSEEQNNPNLEPVQSQQEQPSQESEISEPDWSSIFMPDWMIIVVTVGLYLIIISLSSLYIGSTENAGPGMLFFGIWILFTLVQGYITRWLTYDRGLHEHSFHPLDIFYGGPLSFLLARRIYESFRWRYFILSIIGWVADFWVAALISNYYFITFGDSNFMTLQIPTGLFIFFIFMAIIGGYITGLVLRMAHQDAYDEAIDY